MCAKQHWNQGRLPVVTVKEIWNTENLGSFEYRPAEKSEAFGIIWKIAGRCAVETIPIEKRRVIHEKEPHARVAGCSEERTETIPVIKRHSDALHDGAFITEPGQAVAWKVNADFVS